MRLEALGRSESARLWYWPVSTSSRLLSQVPGSALFESFESCAWVGSSMVEERKDAEERRRERVTRQSIGQAGRSMAVDQGGKEGKGSFPVAGGKRKWKERRLRWLRVHGVASQTASPGLLHAAGVLSEGGRPKKARPGRWRQSSPTVLSACAPYASACVVMANHLPGKALRVETPTRTGYVPSRGTFRLAVGIADSPTLVKGGTCWSSCAARVPCPVLEPIPQLRDVLPPGQALQHYGLEMMPQLFLLCSNIFNHPAVSLKLPWPVSKYEYILVQATKCLAQ